MNVLEGEKVMKVHVREGSEKMKTLRVPIGESSRRVENSEDAHW